MAPRTWKAGIVGCGNIAGLHDRPRLTGPVGSHAQAYHRHPAFQLAAAVDTSADRVGQFQQQWHIPQVFSSLQEMLARERLEVVSLCTPDERHYPQTLEILQAKNRPRVLFIEKPLCLEAQELQEMIELADQTGVEVLVNHSRRFDRAHRRVSQMVQQGEMGVLLGGRGVYYGGWLHNGIHLVDTLRLLLGPGLQVAAAAPTVTGKPGDPDLAVTLKVGQAELGLEAFEGSYYQLFELELRFTLGRLRFLDFGSQIHVEAVVENDLGERELKARPDSPWVALDSPLFEAVAAIEAQLHGAKTFQELGVDLHSAAETMKLMWQARELAAGIKR